MICFPNAKINLGLNIVNKRPDGYHNIETIFYPIPVKDALEIVPAETTAFKSMGIEVTGAPENNLVMKAYNLLAKSHPMPALEIILLKKIPFGAGLGGGSADAAFMLKLLNEYCELNLTDTYLEEMAASIGADCPFFIQNKPVFASGIGDLFEPVNLSLSGYHLCLVKADIFVSTPQAYAMVQPAQPKHSLKEICEQPIETWKEYMVNDFEASIFAQHPSLQTIKESLYEQGAVYASMSGSGSSVFGLFKDPTDLQKTFPTCYVWEGMLP